MIQVTENNPNRKLDIKSWQKVNLMFWDFQTNETKPQ